MQSKAIAVCKRSAVTSHRTRPNQADVRSAPSGIGRKYAASKASPHSGHRGTVWPRRSYPHSWQWPGGYSDTPRRNLQRHCDALRRITMRARAHPRAGEAVSGHVHGHAPRRQERHFSERHSVIRQDTARIAGKKAGLRRERETILPPPPPIVVIYRKNRAAPGQSRPGCVTLPTLSGRHGGVTNWCAEHGNRCLDSGDSVAVSRRARPTDPVAVSCNRAAAVDRTLCQRPPVSVETP